MPIDPTRPEEGRRSHSRAGFANFEDANDELTLLRADLIRKVPQSVGRDTFRAYGHRWLDGHACGNGTRVYVQRVLDALDPYIGSIRLADVRATDLAAAYRGLEKGTRQVPSNKRPRKGLATSTVARHANWVNTIFLAALDDGLVVKNPANSKQAGRPKGESGQAGQAVLHLERRPAHPVLRLGDRRGRALGAAPSPQADPAPASSAEPSVQDAAVRRGARSAVRLEARLVRGPCLCRRMHKVVVGALIREGRVLLVHRRPDKRAYPNVWDLPGGVIENDESELSALTRELHEELGVRIATGSASHLCRVAAGPTDEPALLSAWLVRDWQGTPANAAPEEHDDIGWFTLGELPPPAHELVRAALLGAIQSHHG